MFAGRSPANFWLPPGVKDLDPEKKRDERIPKDMMDTGLVAVLLVIKSRDGPRLIYHYPPHPSSEPKNPNTLLWGTEMHNGNFNKINVLDIDSDDSDLEEGKDMIALKTRLSSVDIKGLTKLDKGKQKAGSSHVKIEDVEGDDHYEDYRGDHWVPWEHLLDFSSDDLESILTPSRAFHKQRFDLSLDPLHYVAYPVHIREDGNWKKKRAKKTKKAKQTSASIEVSDKTTGKAAEKAATPIGKSGNDSDDGEDDDGGMTMFNVVFVMDVGKQGAQARIDSMYEFVCKKFSKALSHAQAYSNYVWKESEMILAMKDKAKEDRRPMSWLWNEINMKSTLAVAIRDIYTSIVNNKIATVNFATKPPLDLSLQIPIPAFLTRLPGPNEIGIPGMIVTSANPMINEDGEEDPSYLNKHFALLLMDDESKIIADIQSDNIDLAAPLTECIRLCKPTLSFLQVAQTNSIDVGSLLVLAQHLILWRRAIAIPPLHARETYVVSPNCDMRQLPVAGIAWKKAFPFAPTLQGFLAALSAAPRPYKTFSPSKDHRPTYIEMLAWLIRGGWVTQLRTFAWILVWPEIVYEVEYQLKADAIEKAKNPNGSKSDGASSSAESTDESGNDRRSENSDPNAPLTTQQVAENARLERLAQKVVKDAADAAASFAQMPKPVATENPSCNDAEHLQMMAPYVIKDPHKVSHEESLYIKAIGERFTDAKPKECWSRFFKHFNGLEALEMIALKENMKRKETMTVIMAFQEHLLICKHW